MNMSIVHAVINFILKIIALFKNSNDTVDIFFGFLAEEEIEAEE